MLVSSSLLKLGSVLRLKDNGRMWRIAFSGGKKGRVGNDNWVEERQGQLEWLSHGTRHLALHLCNCARNPIHVTSSTTWQEKPQASFLSLILLLFVFNWQIFLLLEKEGVGRPENNFVIAGWLIAFSCKMLEANEICYLSQREEKLIDFIILKTSPVTVERYD